MAKLTKLLYTALTDVPSTNLNAIQDEAINAPIRLPAGAGYETSGVAGFVFNAAGTFTINSNAQVLTVPLSLKPGVRLSAVRARVQDQAGFGGGTASLSVRKATDGASAIVAGPAISSGAGTAQTLALTGLTEDVPEVGVSVGIVYLAEVTFVGAVPQSVYSVEFDTDVIP